MAPAAAEARPPAVEAVNEAGRSAILLACDHASNFIPAAYRGLGLGPADLARHIAWDIGAAAVARRLAQRLDAALFLSGYSRLLIDCNRPPGSRGSVLELSEATPIPGNRNLGGDERARREAAFFHPYHARLAAHLDRRRASGRATVLISVHSFTPRYLGEDRPWHVGVLFDRGAALGRRLIAILRRRPELVVGENQPYRITREDDYTVPVQGDGRGIPALLLELRQDLIADAAGAERWAALLAPALAEAAESEAEANAGSRDASPSP
jgi:predicted N-formylglutamate amidohydrolase